MKSSKLLKLLAITLFLMVIAGCSAKQNTQPPETPTSLETPTNTTSLILIGYNDAWQSGTKDGLYGYDINSGWGDIEYIFLTDVRYCKPWGAGFVLTFDQNIDSFFYIAIYNADDTPKTLYIDTYDNKTPPYNWKNILQEEIKADTAKKFQVIKVNISKDDFYDTEDSRDGIQQKFSIYAVDSNGNGVDTVKVAYIGNPGEKPELLFSKVEWGPNLVVDISNIGLKPAENVTVNIYSYENGQAQILATQTISLLNPNTTKELIFENASNATEIRIDPDNTIEEIIEENNETGT
ncbi:MAG: CARDB domain-containing protein [Dictyoglomus sp.]